MTIVYKETNASNLQNFGAPKINKRFEDKVENVAQAAKEVAEASQTKDNSAISFENTTQALNFDFPKPDEVKEGSPEATTTSPPTDAEKRAARREEFRNAANAERRAMEMQKQAQAQLNQAKQFQALMEQAKKDPTAVARALGMEPTEFLRQYQNAMFNIPTTVEEPKLNPEEEIKQRLSKYEDERRREKEEFERWKSQTVRNDYISAKILPVITSDPDKFELLNQNGKEACAGFIYDMMDAHYRATGEELNPSDVAEEMENQLVKEFEEKIAQTKKVKKFSKHFRYDTDAPGQEVTLPGQLGEGDEQSPAAIQVRTSAQENQASASQLGANDTSLNTKPSQGPAQRKPIMPAAPTPTQVLGPDVQANAYQRQTSMMSKKEQRIRQIEEYAKKAGITRNT